MFDERNKSHIYGINKEQSNVNSPVNAKNIKIKQIWTLLNIEFSEIQKLIVVYKEYGKSERIFNRILSFEQITRIGIGSF